MADHDLIDQYLTELRGRLGHLRHVDAICAETHDHLLAAVERHRAAGMDHDRAQRRAIADYGAAGAIARGFVRGASGAAMVPTRATALAGTAALVAAVLWLSLGLWAAAAGSGTPWLNGRPAVLVLMVACAFTVWAIAGLLIRHGGIDGALGLHGVLSLVLVAVGPVTVFTVWSVPSWLVAVGLATLLVGSGLWAAGLAPRAPAALLLAGPLTAKAWFWVTVVRHGLETNGIVPYPGETAAFAIAGTMPTAVGMVLLAAGLAGLGRWLRSEEPVEGRGIVTA